MVVLFIEEAALKQGLFVCDPRHKNAVETANNFIIMYCFNNNVLNPVLFKSKLNYSGKEGLVEMMNGYCFS